MSLSLCHRHRHHSSTCIPITNSRVYGRYRYRSSKNMSMYPVGALRVCPCIADRDRRTDAAWSNSSGTKATRYGAILCLSLEIHRSTHIHNIYNDQQQIQTPIQFNSKIQTHIQFNSKQCQTRLSPNGAMRLGWVGGRRNGEGAVLA